MSKIKNYYPLEIKEKDGDDLWEIRVIHLVVGKENAERVKEYIEIFVEKGLKYDKIRLKLNEVQLELDKKYNYALAERLRKIMNMK